MDNLQPAYDDKINVTIDDRIAVNILLDLSDRDGAQTAAVTFLGKTTTYSA